MIGRKKEIHTLRQLCNSDESKLAVLYGRRRIGKTYLIDELFTQNDEPCIFFNFTGDYDGVNKTQLANFAEAIYDWFKEEVEIPSDWTSAFRSLKRVLYKEKEKSPDYKKIVLFFDEVPWIDKLNKTDFESALGHFWNAYCLKQKEFLMILCGSNASWMKNKILDVKDGPHYKRVDEVISLKPFTLKETAEYLKEVKKLDIDYKTITDIYMVFGGVAKYLSYYKADKSLAQNINDIFFSIHGLLYKEYDELFKSLFIDKDNTYKKVVSALADKKSGLGVSQLADILDMPPSSPKLRRVLHDLEECGFTISLNKLHLEVSNQKHIIADPFILFYKKWVESLSMNSISRKKDYWQSVMNSQAYSIWAGFSFEITCIVNIDMYLKQRGMSGVFKTATYWNHKSTNEDEKGAQIDILIEYEKDTYDIVECKYSNDQYTITKDYKTNLLNKKESLIKYGLKRKKYDIKLFFISTYGVKENNHYNDIPVIDNYTLEDLFS